MTSNTIPIRISAQKAEATGPEKESHRLFLTSSSNPIAKLACREPPGKMFDTDNDTDSMITCTDSQASDTQAADSENSDSQKSSSQVMPITNDSTRTLNPK